MRTYSSIANKALDVIRQSISPIGLRASANATDNYGKVWSRDSMMTGIAGLLTEDQGIIDAFRNSIITLSKYQGPNGQLPSNVGLNEQGEAQVSYGGLVGRVDATTWWIIGAGVYLNKFPDEALKTQLFPIVKKALGVLESWEYNGRGLMWVPLGGNWADEYVSQGYTLYDQVLRLWAMKASQIWGFFPNDIGISRIGNLIANNYRNKGQEPAALYHPGAFAKAEPQPYWWSSLTPAGYDVRWDMAGNALAMLLGIGDEAQCTETNEYLCQLASAQNHWLLPVFSPAIQPGDADWHLLAENYSYRFKNHPNHFHNGGAWPIFLGWLGLALSLRGHCDTALCIYGDLSSALAKEQPQPFSFYEYWNPVEMQAGGVPKLCFSASGALLLEKAISIKEMDRVKSDLLLNGHQ